LGVRQRRLAAGRAQPQWDIAYAKTEYPPIDQLEMAVVGRVYRLFDPQFRDSPLLSALVKLPGLIAEVVSSWPC
jgi:hypothetical protein